MGHPQHILVINGPNLNLLGLREPQTYGTTTIDDLVGGLAAYVAKKSPGLHLSCFQSNHEGEILDVLHSCHPKRSSFSTNSHNPKLASFGPVTDQLPNVDAIVINAGALTHTSVALRDALVGIEIPFIEVHISNVHAREEFRHKSFMCDKAVAVICGLGTYGYVAAIDYFVSSGKWL